jgi:hypothetical protein
LLGPLAESMGIAVLGEDGEDATSLLRGAGADAEHRAQVAETNRKWNQRRLMN